MNGETIIKELLDDRDDLSSEAKNFICQFVRVKASDRIGLKDSLSHPWFSSPVKNDSNLKLALQNMSARRSSKRSYQFEFMERSPIGATQSKAVDFSDLVRRVSSLNEAHICSLIKSKKKTSDG